MRKKNSNKLRQNKNLVKHWGEKFCVSKVKELTLEEAKIEIQRGRIVEMKSWTFYSILRQIKPRNQLNTLILAAWNRNHRTFAIPTTFLWWYIGVLRMDSHPVKATGRVSLADKKREYEKKLRITLFLWPFSKSNLNET